MSVIRKIVDIPVEVLCEVCEFLKRPLDFLSMSLSFKGFFKYVMSRNLKACANIVYRIRDQKYPHNPKFTVFKLDIFEKNENLDFEKLNHLFPNLRNLDLSVDDFADDLEISSLEKIENLYCDIYRDEFRFSEGCFSVSIDLPSLRTLKVMTDPDTISSYAIDLCFDKEQSELESMDLLCCYVNMKHFQKLPSLRELKDVSNAIIDEVDEISKYSVNPNLESLHVGSISNYQHLLEKLESNDVRIKSLRFRSSDVPLRIQHQKYITKLDLFSEPEKRVANFQILELPNLRELNLNPIRGDISEIILQGLPNLFRLIINSNYSDIDLIIKENVSSPKVIQLRHPRKGIMNFPPFIFKDTEVFVASKLPEDFFEKKIISSKNTSKLKNLFLVECKFPKNYVFPELRRLVLINEDGSCGNNLQITENNFPNLETLGIKGREIGVNHLVRIKKLKKIYLSEVIVKKNPILIMNNSSENLKEINICYPYGKSFEKERVISLGGELKENNNWNNMKIKEFKSGYSFSIFRYYDLKSIKWFSKKYVF